ncbi:MAG: DoxX family membrane protein [Bacilli bacterium]
MFIQFLQNNIIASYALLLARLYLGYEWLIAGWGKISGEFDAAGFLHGAIANASGEYPSVLGWWASFLESFALPNIELFNFLVAWGEVAVGLGLILGAFTKTAAFFGAFMNVAFMLSGAGGMNVVMLLISMPILVSGQNGGKIGLDRFFIRPLIERTGLLSRFR